MSFTNTQIEVESLPEFDAVELQRLSPRYAPLVLVSAGCFWAIVALGIAIAGMVSDGFGSTLFSVSALPFELGAGVLVGWLLWVAWKSASVIRYAVREHDVVLQTGIFWRKETIQPLSRIQHVEQFQGPLDKRFGLYTLKLFSAGTGHVTFQIPGLDVRTAARLKRYLLRRIETSAVSQSGSA